MIIFGLGLIGTAGSGTVTPPPTSTPVPPSQVSNLATGTPTASAIPISYTAATGDAPITYVAQTQIGSAGWVTNGGAFGSTGGTLTGLTASTAYGVRVVATNSAGSSTTTVSGTVTTAAAPAILPPSTNATKYFATARKSAVAPGQPVTIDIEHNGIIPTSGTITATSSGSGSFAASAVTMDGTAKTFVYTPATAGEHNISFTNSGTLYNSAAVPLNVFAASSGSAQAIAATLRLGDQAVHQRDTSQGVPTGFSTANTSGWGEVWVNVDRAVPALFARIYDRRSNGWSAAVGSGTELTSGWVQVYGATSGAKQVRLLLPAIRAKQQTLELATDAAGTNPVRVSSCYAVGTVILLTTRSQITGHARGYAMGDNDNNGNHINKLVNWFMTCISVASAPQYGGDTSGNWARIAGEVTDPVAYKSQQFYDEPTSNATMEDGRIIDQQTGTMLGITGVAYIGGGWQAYVADDGTVGPGTMATAMAASAGKARYWILAGGDFDDRPDSDAAYSIIYDKAPDWVMRNVSTMALCGVCMGASGYFGSDGSRDYGHTRNQLQILTRENALPHMVSIEDYHWNSFQSGHATQGARVPYAREHMRELLNAERASWGGFQTQARGPYLAPTGTRSGTLVRLPYKLNGATGISAIKFTYPNTGTFSVAPTTSASDLASLIAVYPGSGRNGDGSTPLPITGCVINKSNPPSGYDGTLDVTLVSVPTGPITVHFASDFGASGGSSGAFNSGYAVVIVDNIDPLGFGYGQHMRPAVDIAITSN